MKTLKECIAEAEAKRVAIGHFNISDSEGFRAIIDAATELNVPVIIGVAEGEGDFLGLAEAASLVAVEQAKGLPVYLDADHCYSAERAKAALDAGFDMVIIDGADKPYEENVSMVKEVVEYARGKYPEALIEAELGFIGQGSQVREALPEGVSEETQTKPEAAAKFVADTGLDLLAPSVGNIHGMVKGGEPKLNIERIKAIKATLSGLPAGRQVPLVLHGASGNSDEDIRAAIEAGIAIVHINTELRLAYKEGIKEGIQTEDVAPYKFLAKGVEEMKKVALAKLKLFNNIQ